MVSGVHTDLASGDGTPVRPRRTQVRLL